MSENGQLVKYQAEAPIKSVGTLKALLHSAEGRIAEIMPKHISPDRLLKLALVAANQNPKILNCTQESVIQAVMRSAELGLDCSGTLGEAYLVPYGRSLQFIPGYRGLVKLARQSGEVKRVEAQVVHENDHFEYRQGTELVVDYRPCYSGEPGPAIGAYALIQMADGTCQADYMRRDEIEKVKGVSKAASNGPWRDWEEEMWKKTVLRRLMKLAPLSSEKYQKIIEYDNDGYDLQAVKNRVSETEDLNRRLGLAEPEEAPEEPAEAPQEGDPSQLTDEEKAEYGIEE